jgi:cell division transport system ATP-binding protein
VALSDVTLSFESGEFVFLTGPSGAGKTTLLRLLFREETPSEGRVLVHGRNLAELGEAEVMAYRRDVGFVFQDFRLLPERTVFENLSFVLRALGTPHARRKLMAWDALARVGLQHRLHSFPRELSGGEQQRIAIARALIDRPRLLLADEPTGSLDPELARSIMDLFRDLSSRGTTLVVASHDRALLREMRKRTITLDAGRVVADGKVP